MRIVNLFVLLGCCLLWLSSCQKELKPYDGSGTDTSTASQSDRLKDSVYLYSKEVYLWHEVIPPYNQFNPRGYSGATDLASAQAVMDGIRALQPLDRYSFVTTIEESNGLQTGASGDFGFMVKPASLDRAEPYDSVYWFVEYVYNQSSAGKAGVQRGWYVSKINNTSLAYDQPSVDLLNNVFYGNTTAASFEFTKQDGSTVTYNLNTTDYVANSVLYSNVITSNSGSNKIGYLVFNQFFGAPSRQELVNAFTQFESAGINDLIVDLRYNHGGSTATQDTLADLIAPLSANNQKMYTYIYNDSLQAGNFPLLRRKPDFAGYPNTIFQQSNNTEYFQKAGGISLPRVFFIVGNETASASELLINNLRPYMSVKLVGDTTYGKPVGFFPIEIFNLAIYPISFKTVNSAGSADYYSGFAPDKLAPDGVNKNWGDLSEPCLATVLNYISTGSFGRISNTSDLENRRQLGVQKQYQLLGKKVTAYKLAHSGLFKERK
jgi:C-terminal processing protease CtpA/Prc